MNATKLTSTSAYEAFAPLADRISKEMERRVRFAFQKYCEETGGGIYQRLHSSSNSAAGKHFELCRRYVTAESGYSFSTGSKLVLAEAFLTKEAREFGEASVLGFVAKLIEKLGDIEVRDLTFFGGADFTINARHNGHNIRVDQQTVYKYSARGSLYCQFPARIYVDGKFTPAARYDEAVAAKKGA